MSGLWLPGRVEEPVLNFAVLLLDERRGSQAKDEPSAENEERFTILELCIVAFFLTVMLVLSALEAHHRLNAFGLTLLMAAGFVATPKLLGNSLLRSVQATQLGRLKARTPEDVAETLGVRRLLALLLLLAVAAVLLESAGTIVMVANDRPNLVGVWLFAVGTLALFVALIGASLWPVILPMAELVVSEAQEVRGLALPADPRDRAWVIALVLFVVGTLLQFADALIH